MASNAGELDAAPFPLSYLLVGVLSILAAWLASVIVGLLVPSWRSGAYLIGAAAAIGSAVLLREAIARERPNVQTLAALRVRELLTIGIAVFPVALILRYLPWDPLGLLDMLLNIWFDPQSYVDGRDLLTVLLLIGAWAFPIRALDYLERLVVTAKDLPPPRRIDAYDDLTAVRSHLPDLSSIQRKLMGWVLSTTIILAVVIGVFWRALGTGMHLLAGATLLLYAALGFTLLALGNYQLRQSRWLIEGITPEGQSAERWATVGGALSAGLAVVALVIPAILLLAITRGLILGALLIFFQLMRLLGMAAPQGTLGPGQLIAPPLPFLPPPPPPPPTNQHPTLMPDWLAPVAMAMAFFLVGLAVIALASWLRRSGRGPQRRWLRSLGGLVDFLASLGLSLRRWLASLRLAAASLSLRLQRAPRAVLTRLRTQGGPPSGSGADLVRYWYGQMVRQGTRAGLVRRPGQTAQEYRAAVREQVTEAAPALDALTSAYDEARYSGHSVSTERGTEAQTQYRQVRQALAAWLRRKHRAPRA